MNSLRSQDKTTAPKSELQTLHLNENENEAPIVKLLSLMPNKLEKEGQRKEEDVSVMKGMRKGTELKGHLQRWMLSQIVQGSIH